MTYSSTLQEIVRWLVNVPARPRFKAILKLVFQGTRKKKKLSFALWCEHTKPATQIVKEIQLQVRAKLLGLDREKPSSSQVPTRSQESFISTWFDRFQT
ncbi:hypothetical protein YC2023_014872 [Brassica napus]